MPDGVHTTGVGLFTDNTAGNILGPAPSGGQAAEKLRELDRGIERHRGFRSRYYAAKNSVAFCFFSVDKIHGKGEGKDLLCAPHACFTHPIGVAYITFLVVYD